MKELTVFKNEQFGEIRAIERDGESWLVGKDVAEILGYKNPQESIRDHVDEEDKGVSEILTPGGKQKMPVINESGFYSLVLSSKLSKAKEFKHWVTSEVLPVIRKHGIYATSFTVDQMIADPDYAIGLLQALKAERVKNVLMKPKADYFDALVDRKTLTGIRETAKELGVGQKKCVEYLLEHNYLYRDQKGDLQPYQVHVDAGLFALKECTSSKTGWSGTQLMVTPKGKEILRLLLKKVA